MTLELFNECEFDGAGCLIHLKFFFEKLQSASAYLVPYSELKMTFHYIHTEKYSPKSCVVNFDMQMSASQSKE